jgi:hypothetical protein
VSPSDRRLRSTSLPVVARPGRSSNVKKAMQVVDRTVRQWQFDYSLKETTMLLCTNNSERPSENHADVFSLHTTRSRDLVFASPSPRPKIA